MKTEETYETPSTKKTQVELEDGICGAIASKVSVEKSENVEVDEYIDVTNDVTFE